MYPHSYLHYTCSPSFQKEVGALFCSRMCGCRKFHFALCSGWVCDRLGGFCALSLQELSEGLGLSNVLLVLVLCVKYSQCSCPVSQSLKLSFYELGHISVTVLIWGELSPGPGCGKAVTEGFSLDNMGTSSSMLFGFGVGFSLRCSQKQESCNL